MELLIPIFFLNLPVLIDVFVKLILLCFLNKNSAFFPMLCLATLQRQEELLTFALCAAICFSFSGYISNNQCTRGTSSIFILITLRQIRVATLRVLACFWVTTGNGYPVLATQRVPAAAAKRIFIKMRYNYRVDIYYRFYRIYNLSFVVISGNITHTTKRLNFI